MRKSIICPFCGATTSTSTGECEYCGSILPGHETLEEEAASSDETPEYVEQYEEDNNDEVAEEEEEVDENKFEKEVIEEEKPAKVSTTVDDKTNLRLIVVVGAIVLAALSPLLREICVHIYLYVLSRDSSLLSFIFFDLSFLYEPAVGIALFSAAYLQHKYWRFIVPIVAMIINDIGYLSHILGSRSVFLAEFCYWIPAYVAIGLIVLMGLRTLKKITITNVIISILLASLIFKACTGIVSISTLIENGFSSFILDILKNIAASSLYTLVLFGGFEAAQRYIPRLKEVASE